MDLWWLLWGVADVLKFVLTVAGFIVGCFLILVLVEVAGGANSARSSGRPFVEASWRKEITDWNNRS